MTRVHWTVRLRREAHVLRVLGQLVRADKSVGILIGKLLPLVNDIHPADRKTVMDWLDEQNKMRIAYQGDS